MYRIGTLFVKGNVPIWLLPYVTKWYKLCLYREEGILMSLLLLPPHAPAAYRGFLLAEPFGAWLRRTRTEKKLRLEDVAEALNTSHVTIQRYETGTRKFPFDLVGPVADVLGVSRAKAVTAWVAANSGDEEIVYEPDPDAIPIPEGYRGADSAAHLRASQAAQEAYKIFIDTWRAARGMSPGTTGFGADRYDNTQSKKTDESEGDNNRDGDHEAQPDAR